MSTFEGIIEELPNIIVDYFERSTWHGKIYFLSHIHTDHTSGLFDRAFIDHLVQNNYYIYTSELSKKILQKKDEMLGLRIKILDPNNPMTINGVLSVTTFPAGHCPGSIMFLFETTDKKIMYTGDIRMEKLALKKFKHLHDCFKQPKRIDTLYFDSTFYLSKYKNFPTRSESTRIICDIIKSWLSKDKRNLVYIRQPAHYGSEFLVNEINRELGEKLFVNGHFYQNIYECIPEMDNSFTYDKSETRIHFYYDMKTLQSSKMNSYILFINPTALSWTNQKLQAGCVHSKDNFQDVCYSSHASYSEITEILMYLKPRRIVPCVVPSDLEDREEMQERIDQYNLKYVSKSANIPPPKNNLFESNDVLENTTGIFNFGF